MGRERILGQVGTEVSDLLARLERILGHEEPDLRHRLIQAVRLRVTQLEDPAQAPEAAWAILWTLYPYTDPDEAFWESETGQTCARAIGHHRKVCTITQASYVLNVSRQRVVQLVDAGRLVRTDSGIDSASLLAELRRRGRRRP